MLVLGSLALSHPAALIAARPRAVRAIRLTTQKDVLTNQGRGLHYNRIEIAVKMILEVKQRLSGQWRCIARCFVTMHSPPNR